MIFKKGDKVKLLNDVYTCGKAFINEYGLTQNEKENFKTDILLSKDCKEYEVIRYGSVTITNKKYLIVFIKDINTNKIYAVKEKDITYKTGWKIYNVPSYLHDDLNQIAIKGRIIRVMLNDGSVGKAECNENDVFDEEKGVAIAYHRAKANSLGGKKGLF